MFGFQREERFREKLENIENEENERKGINKVGIMKSALKCFRSRFLKNGKIGKVRKFLGKAINRFQSCKIQNSPGRIMSASMKIFKSKYQRYTQVLVKSKISRDFLQGKNKILDRFDKTKTIMNELFLISFISISFFSLSSCFDR